MDETLTCDVFIVGGGPAGLSVAARLPADIDTLIVHQDQEIGLPVRSSGGCWMEDVERLGIPPEMYNELTVNEAFADRAHAVIPMGRARPVILDTPRVYQWLAAQSEGKRRLELATKFLTARIRSDGRYESEIRRRDGTIQKVISRYIVDGSGWHFAVLRALGLAEKPGRLAVGTEYEYPLGENAPDRGVLFVGRKVPAGYGWAFATCRKTLRIGVGVIQPDTDASPRKLLDAVVGNEKYLARLGLRISGKPLEVHSGILPSVAYDKRLVFGRVIRVGDSANFATPTVGEGIRICIELGWMLGEELGRAVKSGRDAPLRRYQRRASHRLARAYKWGFLVNTRAAKFTPRQWNNSVRRMSRVGADTIVATFRNDFGTRKIARMSWVAARVWLRGRLGRG